MTFYDAALKAILAAYSVQSNTTSSASPYSSFSRTTTLRYVAICVKVKRLEYTNIAVKTKLKNVPHFVATNYFPCMLKFMIGLAKKS